MKKEINKAWIHTGYQIFAYEGPIGLKVERLAKAVGKNKSSFYHLFGDLEIFTDHLLENHLAQAHVIAEKEYNCSTKAELIEVIVEHKIDLLFSRQLRIHREHKDFEKCFVKTNEITGKAIIGVWSGILGLENNSYLAELVFKLSIENFYLQITDETINTTWLNHYLDEIRDLVKALRKNKSQTQLDGSV